ncbi:latrophilin Cirl-like isoform X3 [Bradysia coprophila]|uniref:latrophilin Cirl-like isoform X3 n=1 Tax=Bradysia coprophila TaxID=38358 RepID=UPI00187D8D30|nr:latrophilin Cirl-like isoform X3 [Bradysia coprophila]
MKIIGVSQHSRNTGIAMYNQCPHRKGTLPTKRNFINTFLLLWGFYFIPTLPPVTAIAPKYETAYACEGKTLTIECEPGNLINLIRANYGRFSITICNDHGNVDWSVNCMSAKSLRVLHSKCAHKQNCSVLASTNMFGDPCPGTHKYLEAHYQCVSAAQTSATTTRPSPPWLITSQPSVWSTSTIRGPTTTRTNLQEFPSHNASLPSVTKSSMDKNLQLPSITTTNIKNNDVAKLKSNSVSTTTTTTTTVPSVTASSNHSHGSNAKNETLLVPPIAVTNPDDGADDSTEVTDIARTNSDVYSTQASVLLNNNYDNYFCGPRTSRNLFWNVTRVGEVNVQPCPGGATGIAKWRCVYAQPQVHYPVEGENSKIQAVWQPLTPDLTHCRSLWLNSLEVRVNQRDSSLISIANELSQVTSSKTLYGGDMLVTTKIIQIMSEKMTYNIETFPDQRQREAIVLELLSGVVKTGSNLLDATQHLSWLDLSFEDQMRVATSLLTGLEDNAFLLADTIIRERNIVQKVKNIFLSVRVLETRNMMGNEIFPDVSDEQWQVSDDTIELPRAALIENSEGGLVRIVFVAFDRLESILKPTDNWTETKHTINADPLSVNNSTQPVRKRMLNSKVISASLGKGRHIQLSQPIRLVLKHIKSENVSNPTCVFWNYIDHAWSEDGCNVESTNRSHTICSCNHLTNFAILMDLVDDTSQSLLAIFDDNLRIMVYVSIAICIIFIVIAFLTLRLFNGVFLKSNRTTIYKNLYICLLVIEALFLFGIEQNETNIFCGFTTAFLHCAFLCTIAWVFFEGYQLYVTLTTEEILLEVEKSSKIIWYYMFTYGSSFTIVAISLAIDPSAYTQADYCVWMEANYLFYFTFVAPVFIYITGTVVYSGLSMYIMLKKYKTSLKNKEHTRLANASGRKENCIQQKISIHQLYLRCSFIFLVIIVSCWIFGYIYMDHAKFETPNANIFGYFFVILNALQGVYIFAFHCMNNEKIRREYGKYISQQTWLPKCLQCSKSSPITSHQSPNIQHQLGGSAANAATPIEPTNVSDHHSVGTLQRHQYHSGGIGRINSSNIIVERGGTNTIGSRAAIFGGQTSPTSSAGSTHLIYNADHPQEWNVQHSNSALAAHMPYHHHHQLPMQAQHPNHQTELVNKNFNCFDDKSSYYDRKMKKLKSHSSKSSVTSSPRQQSQLQQQQHGTHKSAQMSHHPHQEEYFYWTEKAKRPKNSGDLGKSDTMNIVYPSYKKKLMHYTTSSGHLVDEAGIDDYERDGIDAQRYGGRYNQRGQMVDDRPHMEGYLVEEFNNGRQPHFNSRHKGYPMPVSQTKMGYYNQYQAAGSNYNEEPVYEEILSARNADPDGRDTGGDDDELMEENIFRTRDISNQNEDIVLRQSTVPLIKSSYDFNKLNSKPSIGPDKITPKLPMPQQQPQQQQHVSRNLSAILDENNTVVCYLEPMAK